MSKLKFTPGKWEPAVYKVTNTMLARMRAGTLHHAVCETGDQSNPEGTLLALCGDEPGLDSKSAADARLMAAAPEMLEALQDTLKAFRVCIGDEAFQDFVLGNNAVIAAHSAIAKAKGE